MDAQSQFIPVSTLVESGAASSHPAPPARFSAEEKRRMREEPGNRAAHRIVRIRRSVQVVLFSLFVLFFLVTTVSGTFFGIPKDFFMMIDFLVPLYHWILSHHLAVYALGPSLFILVLTLWGGRIFCGWICPLGTLIDISDRLLYRKGRLFYNRKRSETRRYRNFKFIYLLVGLGAAGFAVDILSFGDPLSLITRTFTFCVYPPLAFVWNGVLNALDHLGFTDWAYRVLGWSISSWHFQTMVYQDSLAVLAVIVAIIALSGFQERFWCRNLCPYGALLGLLSRFARLRHYIRMDGCIHCKKCEIQSRHGCYENLDRKATGEVTHAITECIQCFRCETICPTDVIQIKAR